MGWGVLTSEGLLWNRDCEAWGRSRAGTGPHDGEQAARPVLRVPQSLGPECLQGLGVSRLCAERTL